MFETRRSPLSFSRALALAVVFLAAACGDDGVDNDPAQRRIEPPPGVSDFNEDECRSMCGQMSGTCAMDVLGTTDDCVEICLSGSFTDLDFACLVDTPCGVIQSECFDEPEPPAPRPTPPLPSTGDGGDDDTIRF